MIKSRDINLNHRFDIFIKQYFLSSFNADPHVSTLIYYLSIHCINGFIEYDDDYNIVKCGPKTFSKDFLALNESILQNGYNAKYPIPLSYNHPVNGAHRIASCIVNGLDVPMIEKKQDISHLNFSFEFFKSKKFPKLLLEEVFNQVFDNQDNLYCACLFSSSEKHHDFFNQLIKNDFDILIDFERSFNETGKKLLIDNFYSDEPWLGSRSEGYRGAKNKYKPCFVNSDKVKFVCFKLKSGKSNLSKVLNVKEKYREKSGIGKHSIHITDNDIETKRLLTSTININTVHWFNNQKIVYFPKFEKLLDDLELSLLESGFSKSDIIISGSGVLSAYGIRECNDIDLITKNNIVIPGFDNHNYYFDRPDTLFIEKKVFYYRGFMFLNINDTQQFKERRGELKDVYDLKLFANRDNFLKFKIIYCSLKCYLFNVKVKKLVKRVLYRLSILK